MSPYFAILRALLEEERLISAYMTRMGCSSNNTKKLKAPKNSLNSSNWTLPFMRSCAGMDCSQGLNNMPSGRSAEEMSKIGRRFQSGKKASESGRRGGIASGESKRKQKTMKEMLDYLLEKEVVNKSTGEKVTSLEAMMSAIVRKAISGHVESCKFVRSTIGQDPVTKIQEIDPVEIIDDTGKKTK